MRYGALMAWICIALGICGLTMNCHGMLTSPGETANEELAEEFEFLVAFWLLLFGVGYFIQKAPPSGLRPRRMKRTAPSPEDWLK